MDDKRRRPESARHLRTYETICISIPKATLARVDEIAKAWGMNRSRYFVTAALVVGGVDTIGVPQPSKSVMTSASVHGTIATRARKGRAK